MHAIRLIAAVVITWAATGAPALAADEAAGVLALCNEARAQAGARPFVLRHALSRVASDRSRDMVNRGYFAHTDPDGREPFCHLSRIRFGYWAAAENIARGQSTPAAVVAAWLTSPQHAANILNADFGQMGVGMAVDGHGRRVWTQILTD